MTTLIIAEHDNATLNPATSRAISAAKTLGDVHVLVAGESAAAVAKEAATLADVSKVLQAEAPHYKAQLPEELAPLIVSLAPQYSHMVAASTAFGRDLLPRVAGLLDMPMVSDAVKIVSADTFTRPIYAGNAYETVQVSGSPTVLSVRATAFGAAPAGGNAAVEPLTALPANGLSSSVPRGTLKSGNVDLLTARVVVSGGRAFGSAENFKKLESLAGKLGAAIGATRAAVDAGYAPNDWQVGQTGKAVAPELYIAIGISGAIQHLAGMKDSRVIVAINKDENAPIFGVADYGLVADLFTVLPELEKALS